MRQRWLRIRTVPAAAMTLLELVIASALLAMLLTTCVQMLRIVSDQQRAADKRLFAMQTVQNVAEQIGSVPYDRLAAESAGAMELPAAAKPYLPNARLTVKVVDEAAPPAKRTTIELTWQDHRGRPAGPVRLTTWSFPDASSN